MIISTNNQHLTHTAGWPVPFGHTQNFINRSQPLGAKGKRIRSSGSSSLLFNDFRDYLKVGGVGGWTESSVGKVPAEQSKPENLDSVTRAHIKIW